MTVNNIFIITAIVALLATWFIMPCAIKLALRCSLVDKPNERKVHKGMIPRIGGVVFVPIAILCFIVSIFPYFLLMSKAQVLNIVLQMLAVAILFIVGCIDDISELKYRVKFMAQFCAGVLLCMSGLYISDMHGVLGLHDIPEFCGWAITVFAVIYCTNAINFIDGVDGQAALISITSFVYYIFFLAGGIGIIYTPLCLMMLVCLVVYLRYNVWGKEDMKNKTFMGDAGSLTLGCIIFMLALFVNAEPVTDTTVNDGVFIKAFAPLFLPCLDVIRVVLIRSSEGHNPFEADRNHIHHKLLDRGLSARMVTVVVSLLNLFIIVLSIVLCDFVNVNIVILVILAIWSLISLWLNKGTLKK